MPFTPISGEPPRVRQSVQVDDETVQGALASVGTWGLVAESLNAGDAKKLVNELRRDKRFADYSVETVTRDDGQAGDGRNVWLRLTAVVPFEQNQKS